jgi:hypothetical protein
VEPHPPLPSHSVLADGNDDAIEGIEDTTYAIWLITRKIAARLPSCRPCDKHRETGRILAAHAHALKLSDCPCARAYRNALIDAMSEYLDDHGGGPRWTALAKATQDEAWSPMRELVCFIFALPTNPTWFNIFGLMISLEI